MLVSFVIESSNICRIASGTNESLSHTPVCRARTTLLAPAGAAVGAIRATGRS